MQQPNQINQDFIVLSPDKKAAIEASDATLYQRLENSYNGFVGHELIACHEFETDWESWEVHPHGDEVVLLISGEVTFTLNTEAGQINITLHEQGQNLIVPKGVWHTAQTSKKAKILCITPGPGTQQKSSK